MPRHPVCRGVKKVFVEEKQLNKVDANRHFEIK
jgi:hypothetical protein